MQKIFFILERVCRMTYIPTRYLDMTGELALFMKGYSSESDQKKRVEAATNMLKYSDESILSIANYLCFTSQSHFGKLFKEQIGMTPQKYRASNKLIDFNYTRGITKNG